MLSASASTASLRAGPRQQPPQQERDHTQAASAPSRAPPGKWQQPPRHRVHGSKQSGMRALRWARPAVRSAGPTRSPAAPSASASPSQPAEALPATCTSLLADQRKGMYKNMGVQETPMPSLGPTDILVQVEAAGINASDWSIPKLMGYISDQLPGPVREGLAWARGQLPGAKEEDALMPMGKEVAGRVVRTGARVTDCKVGDDVYGYASKGGSYSTHCKLKAKEYVRMPGTMTYEEAAGLPQAALTIWQALVSDAPLPRGGKVLILGGSGGCGSFAVQLAKLHLGAAEVAVTCSESSADFCRSLGAYTVVDYAKDDFASVLPAGSFDCVLDCVGYDRKFERAKRVLAPGGRLLDLVGPPAIGYLRRERAVGPGGNPDGYLKFLQDANTFVQTDKMPYKIVAMGGTTSDVLSTVNGLVEEQGLRCVVEEAFPLEQFEEAFTRSEAGRVKGKLVFKMN